MKETWHASLKWLVFRIFRINFWCSLHHVDFCNLLFDANIYQLGVLFVVPLADCGYLISFFVFPLSFD